MSKRTKEDNPSKYVTHAQCARQVASFNGELKIIKTALVGEDLRGGLVKDVAGIKAKVDSEAKKEELSMKWKVSIALGFLGTVGLIIAELIRLIPR